MHITKYLKPGITIIRCTIKGKGQECPGFIRCDPVDLVTLYQKRVTKQSIIKDYTFSCKHTHRVELKPI